ncbi:Beta-transaminase [Pleurostoma richardsiae]|uniref:Beta-transaminase n=1 Tax=Pleurostoma richardsiae TaxID=41990 RepID=A0AA38VG95_9PEZI|nr:Beta-transaminase [Pleurostoma richardsiae]
MALVTEALSKAHEQYTKDNPESAKLFAKSVLNLPGGTTRAALGFKPFPLIFTGGKGSTVTDADGHHYVDLCGEYSAGLFGHSHPIVTQTMIDTIQQGLALGGVNQYEGKLATLLAGRFPCIEKVRFSNSGTEANLTALSVIKAYTRRCKVIVFKDAYHGGLLSFMFVPPPGEFGMNVTMDWIILPYNDTEALEMAVEQNKDDLACIMVEPMQGAIGCLPASIEFLQRCRDKATEVGAVLFFDEVTTSRMSTGGMQTRLNIIPDVTTLAKYFGGGGQSFGAFGGKKEIFNLLEPGNPKGLSHGGTYNNNVVSMATAIAVMEKVWTPEAADNLFELGEWFHRELDRVSDEQNSILRISGLGSLINVHFSKKDIHSSADVKAGNMQLRELYFFEMMKKGYFLTSRGMICLNTVITKEQLQGFVKATEEFLVEHKTLVSR